VSITSDHHHTTTTTIKKESQMIFNGHDKVNDFLKRLENRITKMKRRESALRTKISTASTDAVVIRCLLLSVPVSEFDKNATPPSCKLAKCNWCGDDILEDDDIIVEPPVKFHLECHRDLEELESQQRSDAMPLPESEIPY